MKTLLKILSAFFGVVALLVTAMCTAGVSLAAINAKAEESSKSLP